MSSTFLRLRYEMSGSKMGYAGTRRCEIRLGARVVSIGRGTLLKREVSLAWNHAFSARYYCILIPVHRTTTPSHRITASSHDPVLILSHLVQDIGGTSARPSTAQYNAITLLHNTTPSYLNTTPPRANASMSHHVHISSLHNAMITAHHNAILSRSIPILSLTISSSPVRSPISSHLLPIRSRTSAGKASVQQPPSASSSRTAPLRKSWPRARSS